MTKKQEPEPFVSDSGTKFEYVWRIWHKPTKTFFKPGRGFDSLDPRMAKTYSRKPSLSVAVRPLPHTTYVSRVSGKDCWRPRDEFEVVEYVIAQSGKTYTS